MPLDPSRLTADLRARLPRLEDDLRRVADQRPTIAAELERRHAAARDARRTGESLAVWREGFVTQAAASWLLTTLFARFIEDARLAAEPRITGPGDRARAADDARQLYFRASPTHSDTDYLLHVFTALAALPGLDTLFGPRNPIWTLPISGDAATWLIEFWTRRDDAGALVHAFDESRHDTRFLGDIYQELSEVARDKYALLQTPPFVERFILDRTLDPALDLFGVEDTRLLDPTCGSGHFLLGAFNRLLEAHHRATPRDPLRDRVQRALDGVWGVDLNPFAAAIARFRLLVAALDAADITHLDGAPDFRVNVAVADSLLHGGTQIAIGDVLGDVYGVEDPEAIDRTFNQLYAAVVGNPPYKTGRDAVLDTEYRKNFADACHRQYSLAVPFTDQFWRLARPDGFVGLITANSFMKREFGTRLIERVLPRIDLTHVIDTAGAYIPGHGTPTVILLGRKREPVMPTVRAALGIRGEPTTPDDAAEGLVWSAIRDHIDEAGYEDDFVSIVDLDRKLLESHPWNLTGGGAVQLQARLERRSEKTLGPLTTAIGRVTHTGTDECFLIEMGVFARHRIPSSHIKTPVQGDALRDYAIQPDSEILFPYTESLSPLPESSEDPLLRFLWPHRSRLWERREPNGTHRQIGLTWYEWSRFQRARYQQSMGIGFAFVATHNHFYLDREGCVFNRSAPVIKLPLDATEDEHLALLGLLNSSAGCFWMKQVFHCKGGQGINEGGKSEKWEQFYEFDGTKIRQFPIVDLPPAALELTRRLDALATEATDLDAGSGLIVVDRPGFLDAAARRAHLGRRIALQEELDWHVYAAYGVLTAPPLAADDPPAIRHGERAFEIVMARRMAAGTLTTAWFERHGGTPTPTLPSHWPEDYRAIVERRIALIERHRDIGLLEAPEYKRRWNIDDWSERVRRNTREWLLARLESPSYLPWVDRDAPEAPAPRLVSASEFAATAAHDAAFQAVAAVYLGRGDVDLPALVAELVLDDAVPALPALRFKASGLRKRAEWEKTWDLQRQEDRGELTPDEAAAIPVPPQYGNSDYQSPTYWRLRGKLDVPKERFILYPHARKETDPSPLIAWAGFDHLQRATALSTTYLERKDADGWSRARLLPLLADLDQLVPWLLQWHNEVDETFGMRLGDFYRDFVKQQAHILGVTLDDVRAWRPRPRTQRSRKTRVAPKDAQSEGGGTIESVYLERLRLIGIKCFADIELLFTHAADGDDDRQANWNVIIGDNGQGKSTLLKAAAACMVDSTTATQLLQGLDGWVRRGSETSRIGELEIEVRTTSRGPASEHVPRTYRIKYAIVGGGMEITRGGYPEFVAGARILEPTMLDHTTFGQETERLHRDLDYIKRHSFVDAERSGRGWLCLGYGPFRRRSGFSFQTAKVESSQQRRFLTLFEEGAALHDGTEWLSDLYDKAHRKREGDPLRKTLQEVLDLIVEVLPDIDRFDMPTAETFAFQMRGRWASIDELSDGYRSMFVLLLDLLRWAEAKQSDQQSRKVGDAPASLRQCQGVVLIDEIDAHLHPIWQREVGFLLTKAFPRLQFIVTTHSPFVAMAAGPQALHVLRAEDGAVGLDERAPSVRGWSIGRVVETVFEVGAQTDPETTRFLEEHDRLRQLKHHDQLSPEQAARFSELEAILSERRRGEPDNPQEQAMHRDVLFLLRAMEKRDAQG